MEGPKAQVIDLRVWSREVRTEEEGSRAGVLYWCDCSRVSKCGQEEAKLQDKGTT